MALTDNLQAFYKLSDLTDSSGNNRTLINNGNVSFASGKLGNAAGVSNGVNVSLNGSNIFNQSTELGISAWAKPSENALGKWSKIFHCNVINDIWNQPFSIGLQSGSPQFAVGDWYEVVSYSATPDVWNHYAMTFKDGTVKGYINGELVVTASATLNSPSSCDVIIGGDVWSPGYFDGSIDALGIWSRALSDAEVDALYNNGTGLELEVPNLNNGLQAFYKLSDTSDSSGNNRTLTNNGNVSFASGKVGNAAVFDGSNYLSSNFAFPSQSNWTLSFWINQAQENPTDATTAIGNWGNDEYEQFIITTYEQGFASYKIALRGDSGNSYYNFNSGITPNIGSWDFVVVRFFNNEKIEMSVNGGQWVTDNTPVNITSNGGNPFVIGTLGEVTSWGIIGQIDSVGIWNRALSDAEVAALYNNGTGLEIEAPVVDLEDGLQAFYKLSDTSDSSGNNRTLTNNGNVSFAPGKLGNAAEFLTGKSISLSSPFNLSEATVAGWVRINHTATKQTSWWSGYEDSIISLCNDVNNTDSSPMFEVCYMSEGAAGQDPYGDRLRLLNGQNQFFAGSAIGDGQWHFFAVRVSGDTWKMKVDSAEDQISAYALDPSVNLFLRMGTARRITDNLEGQIDAVGIWDRALSDAEVAELYNNGTGLELPAGPVVKNGWINGIFWINDVATSLDQSGNGTWVGKLYENGSLFSGTKYELTFVDGIAQPVQVVTVTGNDVPVAFGLNEQSEPLVKLVFATIANAGETTIEQIVPTALPASIPAKYTVAQTLLAYSIDTTATFSGTINVDFILPANISESVFTWCKAYHIKNDGTSEELTRVSSDFATRKITVAITSFSDFLFLAEPNLPPNYKGEWDNFTYYGQDDVVSVNGQYWILSGLAGWTVGGAPGLGYGWTRYGTSLVRISGGSKFYGRVKFAV
jgi:hypothetical protein